MNLSLKWLADYVDCGVSVKEFCAGMTMSGSKVETYETEGEVVKNVIVGKLVSITPHENSDHLQVCQVDVGGDSPIQIVTGAQNIVEGALVPVAMIGAELPGGVRIKKGKLRGVESNGMLCSLGELGLTKHDFPYAIEDGIFLIEEDCTVGQDIHEAIGLNDTSVEFEITSNRPDCLSVVGLAREAAVTFGKPLNLKAPEFHGSADKLSDSLSVSVENAALCPRYIAGMVKNVKIGPSPRWMRERLRASGVRPINNLVDITNYVMLEYGQPMHAFDQRYVKDGKIVVRNAKDGETRYGINGWFGQAMVQSTGETFVKYDGSKFSNNISNPAIEEAEGVMEEIMSLGLYDPTWYGYLPDDGSTLFFGMADWALGASNVKADPNPDYEDDGFVEENDLMIVPFPKQPGSDEYYLNCNFGAKMLVKNSDKGDAVAAYIKCERLAAMIDEYKDAAKEKAIIPEVNAQGKLKSYVTEEQYDALQDYKDPKNITPVFDFGYGMGSRMYGDGEYTYETRGVMNNLTSALLNGDKDSWAVLRDEWSSVIDEVIDDYNNK